MATPVHAPIVVYPGNSVISTHMGLLPTAQVPIGESWPLPLSTRYEAKRPDSKPATNRKFPAGSKLKALGTGSVGTCPVAVNRLVDGSMVKHATLLWPRLGAYKNLPEGVIWIWEQELGSLQPSGRVEIVWKGVNVPADGSNRYAGTLQPCSSEK